ncbi:tRNA binding domain protein [Enterococcus faecalis R712]|nr:tRNA binding domain protein [Enterococcus faecalis R712]EFE19264.1 tRNA binding domain protein [Enterococcus faecalis S613]EFQ10694.1 tRNA binding domain protein [Enterococcus faecalis DAPTO 512]EFQ67519.1 tRNA binding domain protein [Enterococcus faecalis DAPTO 516]
MHNGSIFDKIRQENDRGGTEMIFAYNKEHVGDVLLVIVADDQGAENQVKRVGDVARVSLVEAPETVVAWNIFNASALLGDINGTGQVTLTDEQIKKVNTAIKDAGFSETLEKDDTPKIVVGFVKSCKKHPDSDHLSITQTEVDNGEILQIVCGAPNIKAGQKVVVAKPGAMMPDGLMIWPGVLRGEESFGMICSAKELRLPNAPAKKGILELPFDAEVGSAFAVGE